MRRPFGFLKSIFVGLMFCLERPLFIFTVCFFCLMTSLLTKGSIVKIYQLRAEIKKVRSETQVLSVQVAALDKQLSRAKDPAFLERKAVDDFEYASDDDLVFVFPQE